jgi:hypothetical protein
MRDPGVKCVGLKVDAVVAEEDIIGWRFAL